MPEVPVTTGEPANGLLLYSYLWVGIAVCVMITFAIGAFVIHKDLQALISAVESTK
jgi:hypothetical protein